MAPGRKRKKLMCLSCGVNPHAPHEVRPRQRLSIGLLNVGLLHSLAKISRCDELDEQLAQQTVMKLNPLLRGLALPAADFTSRTAPATAHSVQVVAWPLVAAKILFRNRTCVGELQQLLCLLLVRTCCWHSRVRARAQCAMRGRRSGVLQEVELLPRASLQ